MSSQGIMQAIVLEDPAPVSNQAFVGLALYDESGEPLELGGGSSTPLSGDTESRPADVPVGTQYFDTDLGKPIFWSGTGWVDGIGSDPDPDI